VGEIFVKQLAMKDNLFGEISLQAAEISAKLAAIICQELATLNFVSRLLTRAWW
jgi:hypothetical protein